MPGVVRRLNILKNAANQQVTENRDSTNILKPTERSASYYRQKKEIKMTTKKYKWPKLMGGIADRYYEVREKRLASQKLTDEIEEEEKALREYIIQNLPKSEATGVAGKLARVSVVTKDVPVATDWDKLFEYVRKNKAYDLLQRRISPTAVTARWENNKDVPGVEHFNVVSVSLNKLK